MTNVIKKHGISFALAQRMVDEVVAKARELGVSENVAILDDGGNLKAFGRMDGAPNSDGGWHAWWNGLITTGGAGAGSACGVADALRYFRRCQGCARSQERVVNQLAAPGVVQDNAYRVVAGTIPDYSSDAASAGQPTRKQRKAIASPGCASKPNVATPE